jgi:hypothetical protein
MSLANDEAPYACLPLAIPGQLAHHSEGVGASGMIILEFRPVGIWNDFVAIVEVEKIAGHAGLIRKAGLESCRS